MIFLAFSSALSGSFLSLVSVSFFRLVWSFRSFFFLFIAFSGLCFRFLVFLGFYVFLAFGVFLCVCVGVCVGFGCVWFGWGLCVVVLLGVVVDVSVLVGRFVRRLPAGAVYRERLARELRLIRDGGFVSVFVFVSDVLRLTGDIPHVVRGSAGGSLVCFLLGISDFDPVLYGVSLARFMHECRGDVPDIDIDFPYNRRDEVFERVFGFFGVDRVARISNRLHFRRRSALREARRRLGSGAGEGAVVSLAGELCGSFRGFGRHCGGVVFFEDGVPEGLRLGVGQVCLDKRGVEELGLFKVDFLSSRALAQLADLCDRPLSEYPEDDCLAGELLARGDCLGITLAESPALRRIFRQFAPGCMLDVALALALLRPAAARSRGRLLAGGDPVFVFDDDAIEFFVRALGCSEGEADNCRRVFARGCEEGIAGVLGRLGGRDRSVVEGNFRRLSLYSFCKSHSISYGRLVWALAFWKAREPLRFWVSALNHCRSMYRRWVHFRSAICDGLDVALGVGPWHLVGERALCLRPALSFGCRLDFERFGFWVSEEFFEGCGCEYLVEDDGVFVRFCGLVATSKRHRGEGGWVTFVTVGVGNGEFLDLVLEGRVSLRGVDVVRGAGVLRDCVQVAFFELLGVGDL